MEDFQKKLNDLGGRIMYLKQEKIRIEKEKKSLEEDLAKEGITDITILSPTIETKKQELEANKIKFAETLVKFEGKVSELEQKAK